MATSLARQLKKLTTAQTSLLLEDKTKPSLLFDPKDASGLSRDAVYAIGRSGFEELKELNSCFNEFEESLFSEESKAVERAVLNSTANKDLDAKIGKFLTLASPYFPLRPTHKALEWLVSRFHVHQFNMKEWLACILPYHDTNIFVRALQLVKIDEATHPWHWLFPLQKAGIPLPKTTLYNHAAKDLAFLNFVSQLVIKALKVHRQSKAPLNPVIAFYTTTVIGALENAGVIREEHVSTLLPFLLKGLRSTVVDYLAASYMIVAQLARKTSLTRAVLEELITQTAQNGTLPAESVTLLLVLYETQSASLPSVSTKLLEVLVKLGSFVPSLATLASAYHIGPLLGPMIETLVLHLNGDRFEHLITNLFDLRLALEDAQTFIQSYIRGVFKVLEGGNSSEKFKLPAKKRLEQLERKYPDVFEHALHQALGEAAKKENWKSLSQEMKSLLGFHAFALEQDNLETFLKLNHYRKDTRLEAAVMLVEHLGKQKGPVGQVWQGALADRIEDAEPEIAEVILKLGERLLTDLPPRRRVSCLLKVLNQPGLWKIWIKVRLHVVKLLCHKEAPNLFSVEERGQICCNLVPYMISLSLREADFLPIVTSSWLATNSPFLQSISTGLSNHASYQEAVKRSLALPLLNSEAPELELVVKQLLESLEGRSLHLAPFALLYIAPLIHQLRNPLPYFTRLVSALSNLSESSEEVGTDHAIPDELFFNRSPELVVVKAKGGVVVMEALLHASLQIWQLTRPAEIVVGPFQDLEAPDPSGQVWRITVQLLDLWSQRSVRLLYRMSLGLFMDSLGSEESLISFLSWLWCGHLMDSSQGQMRVVQPSMQIRAFKMAIVLLDKHHLDWTSYDNPILAHAVAALTTTDPKLRRRALSLMNVLAKMTGSCGDVCAAFGNFSDDVETDVGQLSIVMASVVPKFPGLERSLFTHVANPSVPAYVRWGLVQALSDINSQEILTQLLPAIKALLSEGQLNQPLSVVKSLLLCAMLEKFTPVTAPILAAPTAWDVFESALLEVKLVLSVDGTLICPQGVIVELISKEFFTVLATENQKKLLRCLINILVEAGVTPVAQRVRKALKRVSLDAQLLIPELSGQPHAPEASVVASGSLIRGRRAQKAQAAKVNVPGESTDWKRTLLLLELLQNKKKVKDVHLLVPTLFDLLKKCVEVDEQAGVEYSKQVILSVLLSVCQKVSGNPSTPGKSPIAPLQFNVGLLVQCVRVSNNPQTHHHALLLLSLAAKLFPDFVLHNMMTIFTFMGTSILRQDDAYSFQVLAKTLETVVPALLTASDTQPQRAEGVATAVSQVFVDALPDVPEHRRLPVMEKLLETLSPHRSLWLVSTLLCASVATRGSRWEKVKAVRGSGASTGDHQGGAKQSPEMEFALHLSLQYSPLVQFQACVRILQYLQTLPHDKVDSVKLAGVQREQQALEAVPFHVEVHTSRQLCHFKFLVVTCLVHLLSSEKLVGQVIELEDSERPALEALYGQLVEESLRLAQTVARGGERSSALLLRASQMAVPTANATVLTPAAAARFWKTLLQKCYDIVDRVNSLLPSTQFLSVMERLVSQPSLSIRRRAMELLSSKLHRQAEFFEVERKPEVAASLLALVPTLVRAARLQDVEIQTVDDADTTVYQQAALYALKLICRLMSKSHSASFSPVLEAVTALLKSKPAPPLLASTLLALAELVEGVGSRSIPTLHQWMEPLLSTLGQPMLADTQELVLLSAVTALQRTVDTIPHFLSPYLTRILQHACHLSTSAVSEEKQPLLQQRLQSVRQAISGSIAPRVLIPAVAQVYENLVYPDGAVLPHATPALSALMKVLSDSLTSMSREDLSAQQPNLLTFFMKALDARRLLFTVVSSKAEDVAGGPLKKKSKKASVEEEKPKLPFEESRLLEAPVVSALVTMVLKLSEASFRPLFFHLYDWAIRLPEHKQRLITFYHLTTEIADKLKGLFVLFAGHFVKNAAELLVKLNKPRVEGEEPKESELVYNDAESSTLLLDYILACLYRVCLYDNESFFNKERFEALMEPLVNQLENALGGEEKARQRLEELIVPVIAQMAVAASDDALWKALHYQILLKARHIAPQVRLAALAALGKLVAKLGEDYLPLLPEAIPFLAELLEDDENEVEIVAQSTIQEMEATLGEPLQKYF